MNQIFVFLMGLQHLSHMKFEIAVGVTRLARKILTILKDGQKILLMIHYCDLKDGEGRTGFAYCFAELSRVNAYR